MKAKLKNSINLRFFEIELSAESDEEKRDLLITDALIDPGHQIVDAKVGTMKHEYSMGRLQEFTILIDLKK